MILVPTTIATLGPINHQTNATSKIPKPKIDLLTFKTSINKIGDTFDCIPYTTYIFYRQTIEQREQLRSTAIDVYVLYFLKVEFPQLTRQCAADSM